MLSEALVRALIGQSDPLRIKGLTASQLAGAVELLDDARWHYEEVGAAVSVLCAMGWLRMIGFTGAPWELTWDWWEEMLEEAPWDWPESRLSGDDLAAVRAVQRKDPKARQLDLFGEATQGAIPFTEEVTHC